MTAKKKPAPRAYSIDDLLSEGIRYAPDAAPEPVEAAPVAPTGFFRTQGDRALALGQGVVGGVKMLSDLAGPDNTVSQTLGKANEGMQGLYSPARMAEMQGRQAKIDEADASGSTWNQITSRVGGIAEAPAQTVLQAFGSMAPNIAAALATGGVSAGPSVLATAARFGVPAALGVGQGVGSVKGGDYDAVYRKALSEGVPEPEAKALAIKASEYSEQNAPQQALGGALGALAGSTGAERIISGMARKGVVAAPSQGMVRGAVKGAGAEALPEGMQGAQGQYAQNEALNNSGFATDPWAGVVGQGVNDAVVGSMIGAPLGAVNNRQKVPNVGPLSRAANEGIDAAPPPAAPPAPPPPVAPAVASTLMAHANTRAQALDDKAKGTKGDDITPPTVKQFLTVDEKDEQAFLNEHGGDAQALVEAYPGLAQAEPVSQVTPPAPPETPADLPQPSAEAFDQREQDRPAAPIGQVEAGDILNPRGDPFKNMASAMTAQKKAGDTHAIVRVAQGLVVRKKEGNGTTNDIQPAAGQRAATGGIDAPASMEPGTADGNPAQTDQGRPVAGDVGQPGEYASGTDSGALDKTVTSDTLPQHLTGAKPRYAYGSKQFTLAFANDVDKAAYIAAQATPSKRDAAYVAHAMQATGMTEPEVRAHGNAVREAIKSQAKDAAAGELRVPKVYIQAKEKTKPSQTQDKQLSVAEPKDNETPVIEAPATVTSDTQPLAAEGASPEPVPEAPKIELVKVKQIDGSTTFLEKEVYEGDAPKLRMYTKDGKRNGMIHRENLDPTGEKQAANNAANQDNPLFETIATKKGNSFASVAAAQRELNKRGLKDTHEVVPADAVSDGTPGFAVQKKAAATLAPDLPNADVPAAEAAPATALSAEEKKSLVTLQTELRKRISVMKSLMECMA